MNYVDVVIFRNINSIDRLFTYKSEEEIKVGEFVLLDFNNELLIALVLKSYNGEDDEKIKKIQKIVKEIKPLPEDKIKLGLWMREFYVLTYAKVFKTIADFSKIENIKYNLIGGEKIPSYSVYEPSEPKVYRMNLSFFEIEDKISKKATKQLALAKEIFDFKYKDAFKQEDLRKLKNYSAKNFNEILKKEVVEEIDFYKEEQNLKKIELNELQKNAVDKILNAKEKRFLIHGVTGSGKTEIYFEIMGKFLKEKSSVIYLVPEISLTPQMEMRAKKRFGNKVVIFHSKLTKKERILALKKIGDGFPKIVLGTRSAIFSNLENLKLIIIDEEHSDSYKSDKHNKYDAREVARFLVDNKDDAKLILGSATPSIETYYKTKNKIYELVELSERVNRKNLPKIKLVDMREELKYGNTTPFSIDLLSNMKSAINKGEQIMLFLNRRGYAPFVTCRDCGNTIKCDACNVSMVYHKKENYLKCHYCGRTKSLPKRCPSCGSPKIKHFGIGTEKLEEITEEQFADFGILRIDSDTTNARKDYEENIEKILNREVSIIIGTQMITKGLDFPNLTLVGVMAADMSLFIPEYFSAETTFQLITQVAGRAGRKDKEGTVIVQTYNPDHYAIRFAKSQDYKRFYANEIKLRKIFNYPPFRRLYYLTVIGNDYKSVFDSAREIYAEIIKRVENTNLAEEVEFISNIQNPEVIKINNRISIKLMFNSSIKSEKILKKILYDVTIKNEGNLNFGNIHIDLVMK